jgi:fructokinase
MFGKMSPEHYLAEIRKLNPRALFIITRGKQGAIGYANKASFSSPSQKISMVSTIGAGDAFNAGIVYALSMGRNKTDLDQIITSGIAFSSEVCATIDNYVGREFNPPAFT